MMNLTSYLMTILISFSLFLFILDLLSIFVAMIIIDKYKLNNPTEICLLNIFSVENVCLSTELSIIHPMFIWSRLRV